MNTNTYDTAVKHLAALTNDEVRELLQDFNEFAADLLVTTDTYEREDAAATLVEMVVPCLTPGWMELRPIDDGEQQEQGGGGSGPAGPDRPKKETND